MREQVVTRVYCDADTCDSVTELEAILENKTNWILGTAQERTSQAASGLCEPVEWVACRPAHIKSAVITALDASYQ